jgi:hypothetical protein
MESFELLPSKEYGIQNRGERYRIPVTLRTFISIAEGPPFRLFRLDRPMDYLVQSRGFAAIGKRDDLQTAEPTIMFNHLARHFNEIHCVALEKSDHEMEPESDQLFEQLGDWILAR